MADSTVLYFEDENGEEIGFEVIGSFFFEEHDYMVLFRLDNPDTSEVFLTGFHEGEDDQVVFDPIMDDALYERVAAACDRIFNQEGDSVPLAGEAELEPFDENEDEDEDEDFCYQDETGRLFVLDEAGARVYLNEYGEPIEG